MSEQNNTVPSGWSLLPDTIDTLKAQAGLAFGSPVSEVLPLYEQPNAGYAYLAKRAIAQGEKVDATKGKANVDLEGAYMIGNDKLVQIAQFVDKDKATEPDGKPSIIQYWTTKAKIADNATLYITDNAKGMDRMFVKQSEYIVNGMGASYVPVVRQTGRFK